MWQFAHVTLKVLALFAGTVSLCAVFLYEDAEGRIQNKLEEWWIEGDERRNTAGSRRAPLLRKIVRLSRWVDDRLFGPKLISVQAIGVSICIGVCITAYSFAVNLGVRLPEHKRLHLLLDRHFWFMFFKLASGRQIHELVELLARGTLIIVLGIIVTRGGLLLGSKHSDITGALEAASSAALSLTFMILMFILIPALHVETTFVLGVLLPTCGFWILLATVLPHKMFWPLVMRPLYRLQAVGIARRRGLFGIIGVVLIGYAGVSIPEWLKGILEKVLSP